MTKKTLKKFAELSYNKNLLDEQTVAKIADKLSRKDLKTYIRALYNEEKKREVSITSASALTAQEKKEIEKIFAGKKVLFSEDASMITGIKVVEDDQEYEINLNKTFDQIVRYLSTK